MINYFKGLDTLRAIAALTVVWGHIELFKKNNGIPNLIDNGFAIFPSGHIAVILFFVLSGFLITYLLVKEKDKTGQISFKKFYLRRVLRIWPLYYTVILLSFLLFRVDYTTKTIVFCLSIFPNVAHALHSGWPTSPQIWSIGVEEQFYLFWPILLVLIPEKRLTLMLILFFIGYSVLPHVIGFVNLRTFQNAEISTINVTFFYSTKFNCMSIGALIGFSLAKGKKWLKLLNKDIIVFSSIILSFGLWFLGFELKYFTDEFYSILFGIMILGVVENSKIHIDTRVSRFLGKISYGIYMYHWIILLLAMKYISFDENLLYYNIQLYMIVIIGTILISWVSYITIERYFLNLKKQFETK